MNRLASLFLLLAMAPVAPSAPPKLDLNDVSWLWPVPHVTADLANVITITDLKTESGDDVWSDDQFTDLLAGIDIGDTKVGSIEIDFGTELRTKSVWRVASMRVDPSAPGCAASIRAAFGSSPQIRLVVQPVTVRGDSVEVHDVAVHLVYDYVTGVDDARRKLPDNEGFKEIIADLDRLKQLTESRGAPTSGTRIRWLGLYLFQGTPGSSRRHAAASVYGASVVQKLSNSAFVRSRRQASRATDTSDFTLTQR